MAEKSTFIKIDRNIINWRWYTDSNTMRVWIHLLLIANVKDHDFWDATIHRGEVATSYQSIADALELSRHQVRTAVDHLVNTHEVALKRHSKFLVISLLNYDSYQSNMALKRHSDGTQVALSWHQYKNIKNDKNIKNIKGGETENGNDGLPEIDEESTSRDKEENGEKKHLGIWF